MAENNFSALVQLIVDKAQARSALQRELKELQKEAQLETDVKINLSDVKQARKEIAQANREQQEGTRENIKLRAQELAHARMVAKETKVATDLEVANRQREMKLTNQAMSEELASRKRVAQEQKVAAQEELTSRENIRKLNEQTFKEESSARRQAMAETKLQAQEQRALQSSLNAPEKRINRKLDNDVYSTDIDKLKQKFQDYGLTVEQAEAKVKTLRDTLTDMKGLSGDELIKKANEWDNAFEKVKVQLDQTKLAYDQLSEVNKIQLSMSSGGDTTTQIDVLRNSFTKLGLSADEVKNKMNGVDTEVAELKNLMSSGASNSAITTQFERLQTVLSQTQNDLKTTRSEYSLLATEQQRLNLANTIETWNQKNTKATREVREQNDRYVASLRDLGTAMTKLDFNKINSGFKQNENSMRTLHKLGASLKDQLSQAATSFTQWVSVSSAIMSVVYSAKQAVSELKEVDTLLTEISKANDKLSSSELARIGDDSFDVASKYGKSATDYLSGVQEASRAGYDNAEGIAELSVALQGAGDMTDELANSYIIATDKAYGLNGSVEALRNVLDGANKITNENAVNMTELAEGMSVVGSQAASSQMSVEETTAAIGTLVAVTQQGGSEMGNAFKGILMNLRQVTGEVEDGGDAIDESSLTKYEKACNDLGVSLSTVKDGVVSLKEPMQILKELSIEYQKLDESDARRANLLSAVGGKYRANALNAILENFSLYEEMLQDYANGNNSMAIEAEKTAKSWEGSSTRLYNTFVDTIGNIANSDAIITIINSFNSLLSVVNDVTSSLGS